MSIRGSSGRYAEKELSSVIFEQTGGNQSFALIRSKGDQALFGKSTKAKDFATDITIHNARENQMSTEPQISSDHVTNNEAVRNNLLGRGIRPEALPPAGDVKKVERRLASDEKKAVRNPDTLESQ